MEDVTESIETDTNQSEIDKYISGMPPKTKEYLMPSVSGPVDLAIMDSEGREPTIITFDRGEITHLLNVPNSVRVLNINNNVLDNLPQDGVRHLKILSCNGNRLANLDTSNFNDLEELYLNDNEMSELSLPPKLKILEINNNPNLSFLDLGNAPDLKKISCVGNDNLRKIVNVLASQAQNPGFSFKHDPKVEVEYVEERKSSKNPREQSSKNASIEEYYHMKRKYEDMREQKVRDVIKMPSSTINKRKMVRAISRKCVNCNGIGGTKFWRKNDALHAECAASPRCNLKLTVPVGFYANIHYLMNITREDMQEKRANIIRLKMDTLFNYVTETESSKRFKQDLEMYQGDEAMLNTYSDYVENMTNDPIKERLVKKKTVEIHKMLHDVRMIIEKYNKSGDKTVLRDAVNLQVSELRTEIEALRSLKYPVMAMVDDDDVEGIKHLHQSQYNPDLLDYPLVVQKI